MLNRRTRRPFLAALAVGACLSMSLQAAGPLCFTERTAGALSCLEGFLVRSSASPEDTADEKPCRDEYSSAEILFLVPGLPGAVSARRSRILPPDRFPLAEGYPAEIYRPPIAAA